MASAAGIEPRNLSTRRLAIIANVMTPYRELFHRRISEEIEQIELHTILTHERLSSETLSFPVVTMLVSGRTFLGSIRHPIANLRAAIRIASYLHNNRIETVIINGYNDLTRLALFVLAPRWGIQTYLRGDSNWLSDISKPRWKRVLKTLALRPLLRRCSGILAMGRLGRQYFEMYGASPERIYDVPYDVAIDLFRPKRHAQSDHDEPSMPSEDSSRTRLLYVGRLVEVKGVVSLIDSFVELAPRYPTWDLVIAGDGELRRHLEARVPAPLHDRVIFLGVVEHSRLPALMHRCDILVLPSRREPWGVVVTEALAANLPVLTTFPCGAGNELLADGSAGVLVEPTKQALYEALQEAMEGRWTDCEDAPLRTVTEWHRRADPVERLRCLLIDGTAAPAK